MRKGYVSVDQLLSTSNLGYNIIYRILSPAVFISFASLALDSLGLSYFTKNIWLVAVYYYLINFGVLILLGRFALINKFLYFFITSASILLAYWVYQSAIKYGASAILPDSSAFRTEWWFIILAYFYSLLNNVSPNYSIEYHRKKRFLLNRYEKLSKKYDSFLTKEFKTNDFLRLVFYSIMITEDINRPKFFRLVERLMFFTKMIKTTGIMQVTNKKLLTDEVSIKLAQKIILSSFSKHKKEAKSDYELAGLIATDYNGGGYGSEIPQNYTTLHSIICKSN